jgi:HEAT repeat protein
MKYAIPMTIVLATLAGVAAAAESPEMMPVDQAFKQLKSYDYGQPDKALHVIELYVVRAAVDAPHRAQVADRLAGILADPKASRAAKVFVCQQLLAVGTEAQVPLLAKMLDDPQTAEIARFTLQALPGEASLAAIRDALGRLEGLPLVGAINSLGIRRDVKAVEALAKLLANPSLQVAAAAAESLGKIGTAEAAAALMKTLPPPDAMVAFHNAQLQCAERVAAAGDAATAAAMYQQVWSSHRPARFRLAGLAGLAKIDPEKATPLVLAAMSSEEPAVQAAAVRVARDLPGPQATAALVQRLEKLNVAGKVLLLGTLADRGDRSAADAAAKRMEDKEEAVRVAAIQAMGSLGDASIVDRLAKIASATRGVSQQAARTSLARLTVAGVEPRLLAMAAEGDAGVRVEIFRALAARGAAAAAPVLLHAAADADARVRVAAFDALSAVAQADSYGKLVQLLVAATTPADAEAAERAVLATGGRIDNPVQRVGPVLVALASAPVQSKPSLLRLLGGFGGAEALEAVRARLGDPEPAIRDAAVRAMAAWADASAAADLLKIAQASDNNTHRLLAVRGYLRIASELKDEGARLKLLEQIRPIATTAASKRMLLAGVADVPDSAALHVAAGLLDDAEVRAEAAAAVLKIARTPWPANEQPATRYDKNRSDAHKAELAKRPPAGYHLACYLDCGADPADGAPDGPLVCLAAGVPHFFGDSDLVSDQRFASISFDGRAVVFRALGLNPKKTYQIGFTWWDFDHDVRAASVWLATGKGASESKVLDKTKLPSGTNKQGPSGKTLSVPPGLYTDGSLRISFRNEAGPNAVVSELWLWESD